MMKIFVTVLGNQLVRCSDGVLQPARSFCFKPW